MTSTAIQLFGEGINFLQIGNPKVADHEFESFISKAVNDKLPSCSFLGGVNPLQNQSDRGRVGHIFQNLSLWGFDGTSKPHKTIKANAILCF